MCNQSYKTIGLPKNKSVYEAIEMAFTEVITNDKQSDGSDLAIKLAVGFTDIFIDKDSIFERLVLGYEYEKQKNMFAAGALAVVGSIGSYISDARLRVYINGIWYYAMRNQCFDNQHAPSKTELAEYKEATISYERSINSLAIEE